MTPIYQTKVNNCLSAAVASVLDIPLSEVPEWWDLIGSEWLQAVAEWAKTKGLGMCYFDLKNRQEWPVLANHHVIVAGETPRSKDYFHAVVAYASWDKVTNTTTLDFVHDPYKRGDFVLSLDHCLFFVRL